MRRNAYRKLLPVLLTDFAVKLISLSIVQVVINKQHIERIVNQVFPGSRQAWRERYQMLRQELPYYVSGKHRMIFNVKDFHCRVWDKRMKHRISREKAQKAQKIQCKMCELSSANTPPM